MRAEGPGTDITRTASSGKQLEILGQVQHLLHRHMMSHGKVTSDDDSDVQGRVLGVRAIGKLAGETLLEVKLSYSAGRPC